jgi:uncharacterized OB-fold protein
VLAYVDLFDGPRILAHAAGEPERLQVGATVELVGVSQEGDPLVAAVEDGGK